MAKGINFGVGGVVKKVKEVPLAIGGIAKKAKKGVCGVGGVVKEFFLSEFILLDEDDYGNNANYDDCYYYRAYNDNTGTEYYLSFNEDNLDLSQYSKVHITFSLNTALNTKYPYLALYGCTDTTTKQNLISSDLIEAKDTTYTFSWDIANLFAGTRLTFQLMRASAASASSANYYSSGYWKIYKIWLE